MIVKKSRENYMNRINRQTRTKQDKKQNLNFWFLVGLVFLFGISFVKPVWAEGVSLYISPGSRSFRVGNTFSIELKVDTAGVFINAAQTIISFPADKLEVLSISKDNSIFTLWTEEPVFSNSSGKISFSGGLPHPGFKEIGNIITINFKARQEGAVFLALEEGQVLANDGKGTNVLVFIKEAKYFIHETITLSGTEAKILPNQVPPLPQILSSTNPQQKEWYNNSSPQFQWKLIPDITGVSFILDQNSDTIPDTDSEGKVQSKNYKKLDDGIWYFHLRTKNKIGWGLASHYKIQIDTYPPHPFEIAVDNGGDPTDPNPKLYFESNDDRSGIKNYRLKIGEESFIDLMLAKINPFPLSFQNPGQYPVIVRAMDRAGNGVEAKTIIEVESIESPQITTWPRIYISGEETFYVEGISFPQAEIIISLEKDGKEIKNWQTLTNNQGEWSFSTKELIKSGSYHLSARVRDKRGVISKPSESYKIEVSLSGVSLGPVIISFRKLVLFLVLILFLGIVGAGYFVWRGRRTKQILQKETWETKESLHKAFDVLKREIEGRIELMDSQPGFSPGERKVCEELKETLKTAEESVEKEIKDIEKELE